MPDHPDLSRKPTRAETARTDGGGTGGPCRTPRHGLRARSLTPVAALGETRAVLDAHLAAYRRELAHPGPYARDLAEAIACAQLRAARAEHLEAQLLARAAEEAGDLAAPGTRAAWALVLRYRREAELSAKRARQELEALARARAAGLLPDEDEAAAAEAELDAALADMSPIEPRIEKTEAEQQVTVAPAPSQRRIAPSEPEPAARRAGRTRARRRAAPASPPDPDPPSRPDRDLPLLLGPMRAFARFDRAALARFCAGLSPGERLRARAMLAVLEGKARERDQPPEPWLRPVADLIDGLEAG